MFAHRGLAVVAPENTLAAFQAALDVGVHYIETDVHASADGVAIIAHDPDLSRVAGRDALVGDLTAAELARVDLGEGHGFCTLAEALARFPDIRFNIDVKSAAAAAPAARAIREAGAEQRVLVSSFSEPRRLAALRLLPGVVSSASAPRFLLALLAATAGLQPLVTLALRGLVAVQVPEEAIGLRITSPRVIRAVHRAGAEMHVWTINDPQRMTELLDLGVDGIVTDRADLAVGIVARRR